MTLSSMSSPAGKIEGRVRFAPPITSTLSGSEKPLTEAAV